jgi:hypothetical protein
MTAEAVGGLLGGGPEGHTCAGRMALGRRVAGWHVAMGGAISGDAMDSHTHRDINVLRRLTISGSSGQVQRPTYGVYVAWCGLRL